MTCHDRCKFAQMCRLSEKSNHMEESCWEYLHWEDMAWDAECAKQEYTDKDELPFSEELDSPEEAMEFAEECQ